MVDIDRDFLEKEIVRLQHELDQTKLKLSNLVEALVFLDPMMANTIADMLDQGED